MRKKLFFLMSLVLLLVSVAEATTLTAYSTNKDTMIQNRVGFENWNGGNITDMQVGYWEEPSGPPAGERRSLIKFDLPTIPNGEALVSATLRLRTYWYVDGDGGGVAIHLYRMLEPWEELKATWNYRDNTTSTDNWLGAYNDQPGDHNHHTGVFSTTTIVTSNNTWWEFDITDDVAMWYGAAATNYGWLLVGDKILDNKVGFRPSEYGTYQPELVITTLAGPGLAWNASPVNNAENIDPNTILSWSPGDYTDKHNIYFGTDLASVTSATDPNVLPGRGQQDANSYDPCGLELGTTYYWRVDEVNGLTTWQGNVWNFTTVNTAAGNPSPADNAVDVTASVILSWSAGVEANSHDVYFGSNFNNVNDANNSWPIGSSVYKGNQPLEALSYEPNNVENDTIYYWRIDEVNGPTIWQGNVWSFTVRPAYIVREPYLQNTTQSTVDVMWGSSATSGMLYWGSSSESYTDSTSSSILTDSGGDLVHTATITGLTADQKVYYYVNSGPDTVGQNDSSYYAIAAPPNDASFRFAAYGDSRPAYGSNPDLAPHIRVVDTMILHEPNIVLHMGDIAREGYLYEFTDFYFTPTAPLAKNTPVFTTVGNHELYKDTDGRNYRDLYGLPVNSADGTEEYYSFDYGMAHFVCLNSEFLPEGVSSYKDPTRAAEMETWLINDLNDTTQPWTIVFFHRQIYRPDIMDAAWHQIFSDYGVELAIAGHKHTYESYYRGGVTHIVTGGGGSPLNSVNWAMWPEYRLDTFVDYHFVQVDVTPTILYLRAYDDDNNLRKELIVVPNPPPPDMDGDGDTDLGDFAILASAWMSSPGDDNWDPAANISIISYPLDIVIDMLDMAALAENWLAGAP